MSRGGAPIRVLFAEDFDQPAGPAPAPEPEVIAPSFSAADVAAAREAGWAEGYESGRAEAARADAAATRGATEAIAAELAGSREVARMHAEQSAEGVAHVLLDSLASVFPVLCARHGEDEVRAIVRAVLPALAQEPAVTVRANPHAVPGLTRELAELDAELADRVRIVPTDAIGPADVRISWRSGSALRDTAALWQQVAGVLLPAGMLAADAPIMEMEDA
jgi:flagellar assembly protein FliH